MNYYNGFQVFIDDSSYTVFDRKRTIKERFFSLPWRPWVTKLFKQEFGIRTGQVIKVQNRLCMNSQTMKALEPHFEKGIQQNIMNGYFM